MINRTMTALFFLFSSMLALLFIRFGLFFLAAEKKLIFSRLLILFVRLNYFFLATLLWQEIAESMRTTATAFFHFSVHPPLLFICCLLFGVNGERTYRPKHLHNVLHAADNHFSIFLCTVFSSINI